MSDLQNPATDYETVTPSDTVDFTRGRWSRALYVGGTGDVAAVRPDGTAVIFSAVPAGSILPIRCRRVNATSTTATLIDVLF